MVSELLIFKCVNCGNQSAACPQCVNTIRIDPETGLPPDVIIENGVAVPNPHPSRQALLRSEKQPVCDNCVSKRGDTLTAEERHKSGYCFND